jgi:outer membrane receptor protein involved in Fe transport
MTIISRVIMGLFIITSCATGQNSPATPPENLPKVQERVEVTATRLPEEPEQVPAPIEVFTGDELRARGARDLRSAMAAAVGVEIAPGGDTGPASSVPDFWGLKEFDAFLLVVDGVPWGGAFNPALTTLDLNDIERIEVLRGPAPVTYGATSFVGVIQVVHKGVESTGRSLTLHGGSYGSGGGAFSTPIPLGGRWSSRLTVDGEREGFSDDRTEYRRAHGLWRVGTKPVDQNRIWFNADVTWLDQDPASPRLRDGATLSPLNAVDANYNPPGAYLNDHRFTGLAGFDRKAGGALWSTSGSVSQSRQELFRGFVTTLSDDPAVGDNAHGLQERIHLTDFYVDSHLSWKMRHGVTFLAGTDYLHGTGTAQGADFDYFVHLNGSFPEPIAKPDALDVTIDDNRDFFGPYASVEWQPIDRLRFDAGIRLNVTHETQQNADPGAGTSSDEHQTNTRASGNVGAIFTAWQRGQDSLHFYVNYRDTFKPAAIDFGIGDAEEGGGDQGILKPETSRSVEGGIKGLFLERRVEWETSGFYMDFSNLVVATLEGGLPGLINAGKEHFKGFETGGSVYLPHDVLARATYSFHDATFVDFVQIFDDVPTQLAGNRLEMSARHLAAVSLFYVPPRGFLGGVSMNYTGSRFLDKRNRALAEGFPTVDLSAGYRTPRWEIRVDARNVADQRDPVAESELGDAQYYLMTSRRVEGGLTLHF